MKDLELASVAHAFAYFEKLCLQVFAFLELDAKVQGLVTKDTRRIKGGIPCC